MPFTISSKTKRDLANRVAYNYFLRLLIFKFWFRMVVLCLLLLAILLVALLPKIWKATPKNFQPAIRISGVEKIEAWVLQRRALKQMQGSQFDRAHYTWLSAIADNPADPESVRGLFRNLLLNPAAEPDFWHDALSEAPWLLRLSSTNHADVELLCELFLKQHAPHRVISMLSSLGKTLSDKEKAAYLKALFAQGDLAQFRARWSEFRGEQLHDPDLPLYHAADLAISGDQETAEKAREQLAAAIRNQEQRTLASHLQLLVFTNGREIQPCKETLERLTDEKQDTPADHAGYWQFLARNGQQEQARQLASEYDKKPATSRDLIQLVAAYETLGLHDQAVQTFKKSAATFPDSEELWKSQAANLSKQKDWENLRLMAIQMRTDGECREKLAGYAFYLEGVAELQMHRQSVAEEVFNQAGPSWTASAPLALETARSMIDLGFPKPARSVLARIEEEYASDLEYWQTVYQAAASSKDPALLLKSGQKQYALRPNDPHVREQYVRALLINRMQPETALKLSEELLAAQPHSPVAQLGHAGALLRTQKPEEAERALPSINRAELNARDAAALQLAAFEIAWRKRDYTAAHDFLDGIDRDQLFSNEAAWLDETRKNLPARVTTSRK